MSDTYANDYCLPVPII